MIEMCFKWSQNIPWIILTYALFQKMADLGRANEELAENVSRLTTENRDIRENLESQQDTQALAESDKDMSSQIHCLRVSTQQNSKH